MQQARAWFAVALSLGALAGCQHQQTAAAPHAASAPPATAAPPMYSGPMVEVPAGSRLVLRVDDNVDSKRMSPGQRFRSSLDAALLNSSGNVVVPAGTTVYGMIVSTQQAGNLAGKSELELAFTDLQINGALFPIQSQGIKAVGEGSGGDTVKKAGAGALIGGAFGGGSGAAKGAAVGGAVALLSKGKEVRVPSGTIVELTLAAPVKVPAPEGAEAAPAAKRKAAPGTEPALAAPAPPTKNDADDEDEAEKACVKKLMGNGFSADEALSSCNKGK